MIRLYVESPLFKNQVIFLEEKQSHYLQKVMRLSKGDQVLAFNGVDGEWEAEISETLKKSTQLVILSQIRSQKSEGDIWLIFSPLKPKREAFLEEKATELGCTCLWPVHFERTPVPKVNLEKLRAHVIEAAEQCERLTIPEIKPLTRLPQLLKEWPKNRLILFGDETFDSPSLKSVDFDSTKPCAFLVGPEGGFTSQELALLKSHPQAKGVTLNPYILRAETAALVGLSYLQLYTCHVASTKF